MIHQPRAGFNPLILQDETATSLDAMKSGGVDWWLSSQPGDLKMRDKNIILSSSFQCLNIDPSWPWHLSVPHSRLQFMPLSIPSTDKPSIDKLLKDTGGTSCHEHSHKHKGYATGILSIVPRILTDSYFILHIHRLSLVSLFLLLCFYRPTTLHFSVIRQSQNTTPQLN